LQKPYKSIDTPSNIRIFKGMVANTPPTRFAIDPARADEFIDDLSAVENSLRHVAEKWNTTTGALSLFLASPEGLAIVAAAEIATAVHIRLQAQALLVDVAQSMVYIVREYSREERRIPFNNDLRSIKLVELRRANARRAGNLLLRLAHYNPAPIRSYSVRPVAEESDQTCVMPKRPLGHGEANDDSACGTAVALDSRGPAHETHACAEPQACHADETSAPVPPVRRFGATDALDTVATNDSSACHDHPRLCEDGRVPSRATDSDGSSSVSVQELAFAHSTPTLTSIPTESASEIVVQVGAANMSLRNEPASRSPQDCSKIAGGEAALRGAHPRTASRENWTLQGSSPPQTSDPPSSDSGP
jgi:hypothetical protein